MQSPGDQRRHPARGAVHPLVRFAIVGALVACASIPGGCARPERAPATPRASRGSQPGAALTRCVVLLPVQFNDGRPVPESQRESILERLATRFGGYTDAGLVRGAYRMESGEMMREALTEIWVACQLADVPELRSMVRAIGKELGQESMYFETGAGVVELVPCSPGGNAAGGTPP